MTMSDVHHSLILFRGRRSISSIQLALAMLLVLSFILSIIIALGILSLPISSNGADVSISSSNDQKDVVNRFAVDRDEDLRERSGEKWTEVVSWEPRVFIYHNFLSKEECKHLIDIAKPHMERSRVIDKKTRLITDSRFNCNSSPGHSGLALKPKMGNALLFWSLHPEGTLDTSALHAGCPVIRGDKWSSTKWMHTDKYNL